MAAIAFDPLGYTHELEAAGVSREQAEVHAKAMTTMFIHNFDALVTKDYLDTRFSEFETRVDMRFSEAEARVDMRFAEAETRVDLRFAEADAKMDRRFTEAKAETDKRFVQLESKMDNQFAGVKVQFAEISTEIRWLKWLIVSGIAATLWPTVAEMIRGAT